MSDSSERAWATIGRAALVIGALVGLVTLWNWWRSPAPRVRAEVTYGPWYAPPRIHEVVDRIHALDAPATVDELLRNEFETSAKPRAGEESEIAIAVARTIRGLFDYYTLHDVTLSKGYWRATVSNRGDLTATDVAFRIPDADAFQVFRESADPQTFHDVSTVIVGALRPGEEVLVIGWSQSEPSPYRVEGLSLSHASGRGKIRVTQGRDWVLYRLYSWLIWIALTPVALPLIWKLVTVVLARRRKEQPEDERESP